MKKKTYNQLAVENATIKAELPVNLNIALGQLNKESLTKSMTGGVIVKIVDLNDKEIVTPFMCTDGLEENTISALKEQIKKTQQVLQSLYNKSSGLSHV